MADTQADPRAARQGPQCGWGRSGLGSRPRHHATLGRPRRRHLSSVPDVGRPPPVGNV